MDDSAAGALDDAAAAQIFLARHGQTDDNAAGRVQGWIDTPLNECGRRQAEALAQEAAELGLSALYSSQLSRARETAFVVGARIGLEPLVDERFAESRRGSWEGRRIADIERDEPELFAAWERGGPHFRFPGGETLAGHAERVATGLVAVAAGPLPALVVCHGGSIRCALAGPQLTEMQAIAVPNGALMSLAARARR